MAEKKVAASYELTNCRREISPAAITLFAQKRLPHPREALLSRVIDPFLLFLLS